MLEKLAIAGATALATLAARRLTESLWRTLVGREPDVTPVGDPEHNVWEAVAWVAVVGVAVAVAREFAEVTARRVLAARTA